MADPQRLTCRLFVVAPPSRPVCQWDGHIDAGGSVTLSCSVGQGVPTPEIRWERLNPEDVPLPIDTEGQCCGRVHIHTHTHTSPPDPKAESEPSNIPISHEDRGRPEAKLQ